MNNINSKSFFDGLSNGQKLNFEYIHEQGLLKDSNGKPIGNFPHKSKMKYYSTAAIQEFNDWNSKGYGIYFLPNYGGYKDAEITDFRSCFTDLDIKDELEHEIILSGFNGDHHELKKLITDKFNSLNVADRLLYKQVFMNRINELRAYGIAPSAITQTKSGYHVYYFMNRGTQKHQFDALEELLIYCLNGDRAVKNAARLLRVPDTKHLKNPREPFTIQLEEWNYANRYDAENMITVLNDILNQKKQDSLLFINPRKKPLYNSKMVSKGGGLPKRRVTDYSMFELGNIPLISKGFDGLSELKEKLGLNQQIDKRYIDRDDIRQYLKRQDLRELLGFNSERFYCLFHRSSNASSGSIYIHEEKYFYKCHSSSCNVHYDVVNVIERITGLPNYKAFDYLKELYNIAEVKTEWQTEMERLIEINLDLIERFRYDVEFRESHPYLTKFLGSKGTLGLLTQIHQIARRKLPQLAKVRDLNNVIVFAPMNMVVEEIINDNIAGLDKIDNPNTKAVVMIFFYLLNCVGMEQLPEELQRKAKEFHSKGSIHNGKLVHYKNPARYYEIVSLDTDRLIMAEEMARFFYQKHLTLSGFNREQLLRLCGIEEADRVFPDRSDEEISDINQSIAGTIESTVNHLLTNKGWTNDKEIFDHLVVPNFDIRQEFLNTFKFIKSKESSDIDTIQIRDNDRDMQKWYESFMLKKIRSNMPAIMHHFGIKRSRVNFELRLRHDIPAYIKGSVYHNEEYEAEEVLKIEDTASKILRLKREDPTIKNTKIADIIGCSRQYVSKVLKG